MLKAVNIVLNLMSKLYLIEAENNFNKNYQKTVIINIS